MASAAPPPCRQLMARVHHVAASIRQDRTLISRTWCTDCGCCHYRRCWRHFPQVMYYKSGRFTLLSTGFVSFCTLLIGMCLFTLASTHFYWYAAPTIFVIVYICCHCEYLVRNSLIHIFVALAKGQPLYGNVLRHNYPFRSRTLLSIVVHDHVKHRGRRRQEI